MNLSAFGALAPAWPAPAAPVSPAPGTWLRGADSPALLRAEVEPHARGLTVQAHAERVLAALVGDAVVPR